VFRSLLAAGLTLARRRGFEVALTGFAAGHPFAAEVRRHRAASYRSLLHLVHRQEAQPLIEGMAPRLPHPEIAVM
jgi:hypothetical protein